MTDNETGKEKAVLVAVLLPDRSEWQIERSLDELARLAETAGAEVTAKLWQAKDKPDPKLFIGKGKAEEIAAVVKSRNIQTVVLDDELSPSQQLNLEKVIDCKVIDRTALILDIFALHAHSAEGKLQVELAQLDYYLPRLRGLWLHLGRLGGGTGRRGQGIATRGPGETQLETDRRRVRYRMTKLRKDLDDLAGNRRTQRRRREKQAVFSVALVGYTNAGKSSLMNMLTAAGVQVADQLFATLDSTARRLALPSGREVVISDTVGFISKLPHELVAAFKSTLDEVAAANLLLHVVDAADPAMDEQIKAVEKVLGEIGAGQVPRVTVYNKADLLDKDTQAGLRAKPQSVVVSTVEGTGLARLLRVVDKRGAEAWATVRVKIPYAEGSVRRRLYDQGAVLAEEHQPDGSLITVRLKPEEAAKIAMYKV